MSHWLLRVYPPAWRERYGDELVSLIEADADGGKVSVRTKLDVLGAGLVQRLHGSRLVGDEVPPEGRIRAGVLLVLSSWAAFVVAGLAFAKSTEHVAAGAAYTWVQVAASVGTLAVVLGIALVARPLSAFLRRGGWQTIHRPVLRATGASGLTVVAFVPLVIWAHRLTYPQRNGSDWLYGGAFLVVATLAVASIGLWTHAAVVTARQLELTRALLAGEALLAGVTTLAMATMTVAATVWWTRVDGGWLLRMVLLTLVMAAATALAATGTLRSARALRA
jgi:hypothetical protein